MATDTVKIRDSVLLRRTIHDRNRDALSQLNILYYRRIKCYIASHVNLTEDAEDLTQSVFLELCKGKGRYNGQRDAEAYLLGIARNIIGRYHRNKRKQPQIVQIDSIGDIVADCNVQQHQPVSVKQLKKLLEETTEQLPPKAREAVKLRLGKGLDPKGAAKRAGCSVEVFYHRFYEGLKMLRENLKNITL